jgi:uncharacterized membrane protein
MESRIKFVGHPLHPPCFLSACLQQPPCSILPPWFRATGAGSIFLWIMGAGILGGLLAALPGLADWVVIPQNTRAKAIGLWHGGGNVVVLLLFAVSWFIRRGRAEVPSNGALVLSFITVVLALITGWSGGELVDRLGVGVDNGAHLNAPSSLSGCPATGGSVQPLRRAS